MEVLFLNGIVLTRHGHTAFAYEKRKAEGLKVIMTFAIGGASMAERTTEFSVGTRIRQGKTYVTLLDDEYCSLLTVDEADELSTQLKNMADRIRVKKVCHCPECGTKVESS